MRRFSIPVWVAVLAMGPWDDLAATQTLWQGLVVAPESRCSPYDADDYRYPQSVEDRIIAELGGVYGPYTGRWFANKRETDIEHIVARSEEDARLEGQVSTVSYNSHFKRAEFWHRTGVVA